jgi:hypothetical protein
LEDTILLEVPLLPGSAYCLCASGTLTPASFVLYARFDGLFAEPVISLGTNNPDAHAEMRGYPDPATDKLWLELTDVPISITAIDATGRSCALQSFQHTSRTLEVDVSALPSGVNVLRVATSSGNHTVRFIKT